MHTVPLAPSGTEPVIDGCFGDVPLVFGALQEASYLIGVPQGFQLLDDKRFHLRLSFYLRPLELSHTLPDARFLVRSKRIVPPLHAVCLDLVRDRIVSSAETPCDRPMRVPLGE